MADEYNKPHKNEQYKAVATPLGVLVSCGNKAITLPMAQVRVAMKLGNHSKMSDAAIAMAKEKWEREDGFKPEVVVNEEDEYRVLPYAHDFIFNLPKKFVKIVPGKTYFDHGYFSSGDPFNSKSGWCGVYGPDPAKEKADITVRRVFTLEEFIDYIFQFEEKPEMETEKAKYSLAVRVVCDVLAGQKNWSTDAVTEGVRTKLESSTYEGDKALKDEVIEELKGILHWMARKGIIERVENPSEEGDWLWSTGTGRYKRQRRSKVRGLDTVDEKIKDANPVRETGGTDNQRIQRLEGQVERMSDLIGELAEELAVQRKTRKIEYVINTNGKEVKIKKKVHSVFPQVLFHLECGDFPMLVGPSGCGKTEVAIMVAEHLKLRFGMLSWGGGMTESQLYGKTVPNITGGKEVYIQAEFADFYEKGGLFLHDEIDGGDPNVLLSLNAPLSNKRMKLPRKQEALVQQHKDFRCIATANTWGNGADRHYVGRNQMDGATIKRFVLIDMDYDEDLETQLCSGAEDMVKRLQDYRRKLVENKIQRVIDTRFLLRAYKWKRYKKDDEYIDAMLFKGWREDEIRKVKGATY